MQKNRYSTKMLTLMAMLAAMAYVAMLATHWIKYGFLSFDIKDMVVAMAGFMLGPVPALLITLVVSLVEMVTVSETGIIGFVMNVLSTASFALPAAIVYNRKRSLKSAGLGLALSVLCMTVVMLAWNYIITPLYMKNATREQVAGMLLPIFLPFNLSKGLINAGITMLVYKPVAEAVRRAGLLESIATRPSPKRKFNLAATLISLFVLVTGVMVFVLTSQPSGTDKKAGAPQAETAAQDAEASQEAEVPQDAETSQEAEVPQDAEASQEAEVPQDAETSQEDAVGQGADAAGSASD